MIAAVSSARATAVSPATAPATTATTSVLPSPAPLAGDALSMMYLLESEDQQLGLQQATTKVQTDQKTIQAAFDKEQEALKKAEEAGLMPLDYMLSVLREEDAVKVSLENLLTFPWIAERVNSARLRLHGAIFDIRSGVLSVLQADSRFVPVPV